MQETQDKDSLRAAGAIEAARDVPAMQHKTILSQLDEKELISTTHHTLSFLVKQDKQRLAWELSQRILKLKDIFLSGAQNGQG